MRLIVLLAMLLTGCVTQAEIEASDRAACAPGLPDVPA
jgi:hypothetical protein